MRIAVVVLNARGQMPPLADRFFSRLAVLLEDFDAVIETSCQTGCGLSVKVGQDRYAIEIERK